MQNIPPTIAQHLTNWDDLRIMLTCMEHKSMSAAARALGIQQSTVSRRLLAMEACLGSALFLRTPEGIVPTALAHQLQRSADAVAQHIHDIERIAAGMSTTPEGSVDLAITESLAMHYLLPRLHTLSERHPGLHLNILTGYHLTDLVRRESDIAVRFVRPTQLDLVTKRIAQIPLQVIAHERYLANHGAPTLEHGRWAYLHVPGFNLQEQQWFDAHVNATPWLRTTSYTMLIEAVLSGQAVGLIPAPMSESRPHLHIIEVPAQLPPARELWLTAHQSVRHTPRIAAVWAWLEDVMSFDSDSHPLSGVVESGV